ncbi:hypothetical protein [Streptomyces sp. NPDC001480]
MVKDNAIVQSGANLSGGAGDGQGCRSGPGRGEERPSAMSPSPTTCWR